MFVLPPWLGLRPGPVPAVEPIVGMTEPELLVKLDPLDLLAVTPVEPEVLDIVPEAEDDEPEVDVRADSEMAL